MTELKKVVVESFPIDRLPTELRNLLDASEPVRVTLEQALQEKPAPLPPFGFGKGLYASQGVDPADFVREIRDEWN